MQHQIGLYYVLARITRLAQITQSKSTSKKMNFKKYWTSTALFAPDELFAPINQLTAITQDASVVARQSTPHIEALMAVRIIGHLKIVDCITN